MTMTYEQLIEEIKQLSTEERLELLEAISRSLREELQARKQRESIASRLYGIAKPDGPPPSDEEIKEDYTRYLTEKYS
jgi:dihydroneopterin aldolase